MQIYVSVDKGMMQPRDFQELSKSPSKKYLLGDSRPSNSKKEYNSRNIEKAECLKLVLNGQDETNQVPG